MKSTRSPGYNLLCKDGSSDDGLPLNHAKKVELDLPASHRYMPHTRGLTTYSIAQVGKRLILKDGTWQGITQYEVRGDRARYFSSQRGEWEEVPTQLVDWKATEEWNAGLNQTSPELRQFDAEEEVEAEGSGPSVAPGLSYPSCAASLLDTFSDRPSLERIDAEWKCAEKQFYVRPSIAEPQSSNNSS